MLKVVIVAPVHPYDDVRVFQKEAKTLAKHGYEVTLLARSAENIIEDGVTVKAVPRAANRLQRFLQLPIVFKMAYNEHGDIYHLHNPDTIPIGLILKLFGKTVVYDTHEDFLERILIRQWIAVSIRNIVAKIVAVLEKLIARLADLTIVTEINVKERLGKKAIVIDNAPISNGVLVDKAYEYSKTITESNEYRLIYVGGISWTRGLYVMLDSLVLANAKTPCRLWLIGPCSEIELSEAKAHLGWKFVDYLGKLPQWKAFGYIIASNIGLITQLDIGGQSRSSPNKLYEYQLFGIPFIASDFKMWRMRLESIDSGFFADPAKPNDVAEKIVWATEHSNIAKDMGLRGKCYVHDVFNWEIESKIMLSAYKKLLNN